MFTYDMADEGLSEYVDELTWQGWQVSYDDWENPLPETPGNAPKGIYTYRLWAVHDLEGIWDPSFAAIESGPPGHECKDSDKSYRLQIMDVYVTDADFESRNLRFYGDLHYTLSRNGLEATLVVYGPDLAVAYGPVALPTSAGEQTHHFDFTVAANPMNDFYFVVQAWERGEDAALNRDGQAKMALPRGCTGWLAVLSYNFRGATDLGSSASVNWACVQQQHAPAPPFYPPPPYTPTPNVNIEDLKTTYNRLSDTRLDGTPNPYADGAVFYIGHGEEGVLLVGDQVADRIDEIWTGAGANDTRRDCYYMDNWGAQAHRRALVAVIVACRSADDRPAGMWNGPRASVMSAFRTQGAGCAIGYHGDLLPAVGQAFAYYFWLMTCKQCLVRFEQGQEIHVPRDTDILTAFSDAAVLSGMPYNWDYSGLASGVYVRPAHYR
ncbi:MAG: hypothetical protein AB7Y46_03305 [Armatimonadota bacterium]